MTLSVVVPCFNEEKSIPLFYREMERVRIEMGEKFGYIFINDGSSDGTLSVLRKLHVTDSNVHYLSFLEILEKKLHFMLDLSELVVNSSLSWM